MGEFDGPFTELLLPGSKIRIQLNERSQGWRWLPDAVYQRLLSGGSELTKWAPLTGSPASYAPISIRRSEARWCALAGELPVPDSPVVVADEDGNHHEVLTLGGKVWACEWSAPPMGPLAPPFSATVTVGQESPVSVLFFKPRRIHLTSEKEERTMRPGQVVTGWYRYVTPTSS